MTLIGQGDMLADKHADAYAGHVKAVEEGLNVVIDLHALSLSLPLENALRHGGHDTIVSPLDPVECLCKVLVIQLQLRRPISRVVHHGKISPRRGKLALGPPAIVGSGVLLGDAGP